MCYCDVDTDHVQPEYNKCLINGTWRQGILGTPDKPHAAASAAVAALQRWQQRVGEPAAAESSGSSSATHITGIGPDGSGRQAKRQVGRPRAIVSNPGQGTHALLAAWRMSNYVVKLCYNEADSHHCMSVTVPCNPWIPSIQRPLLSLLARAEANSVGVAISVKLLHPVHFQRGGGGSGPRF